MSQNSEIIAIMTDIRDRVIRIETRIEILPDLEDKVEKHGEEIIKAKTSLKMIRWIAGLFFVTVPASMYAMVRVFKG